MIRNARFIDIAGQTFGRLTVVKCVGSEQGRALWACRCECGGTVTTTGKSLRAGNTRSCGCLGAEWSSSMGSNPAFVARRAKKATKHGHKRVGVASVEYLTWLRMKRRCYDKGYKDYPNWGGRGIRVCDAWNNSFEQFLADMGPRPADKPSIDRLKSDQDYRPGNCRWATLEEQGRENRRDLVEINAFGRTWPNAKTAATEFGLGLTTLCYRLKAGWSHERALTTPRHHRGSR